MILVKAVKAVNAVEKISLYNRDKD